jgi:hypothetical protein
MRQSSPAQSLEPDRLLRRPNVHDLAALAELAPAAVASRLTQQRNRLLARLDDPTKRWKHNPGDLLERSRWDHYQQAYEDALNRCSTDAAPWHVVPADRKWYRNWAVATLLRQAFADIDPQYPEPAFEVAAERRKVLTAP